MLDRRTSNGSKHVKGASAAASSQFASIQERCIMKKVAQPEHAYTGCVPCTPADDELDALPKKKNPPILGYRGHLRHDEDRIGTTFTQGLAVASRTAEPVLRFSSTKVQQPNNQLRQVRFADDTAHQPKSLGAAKAVRMSPRSGYGQFDNASGYGNFAPPPAGGKKGMSSRSGYGAFDNASGYGAFAAPPANMSSRSGYGEFENASGYGAFAAPPPRGEMSPRSGYGEFENASGYGAFAAPPRRGVLSPRSGYGEFDNASGYGAFAAPPERGGMSPRSGYGAFDNASGYGAFAAPPVTKGMSPRSGYGEFENASGYGAFAAPPGNGGMSPRSGYGKFDNASGYGHFTSPPGPEKQVETINSRVRSTKTNFGKAVHGDPIDDLHGNSVRPTNNQTQQAYQQHCETRQARKAQTSSDPVLHSKYQQAISRVGGEQAALRLWTAAGQTVWQRHSKRTELLQSVKRSFEKHERANHGFMTKAQLKEALRDLACVFTDDQTTALFGMYDKQCTGAVPMSELLLALTEQL